MPVREPGPGNDPPGGPTQEEVLVDDVPSPRSAAPSVVLPAPQSAGGYHRLLERYLSGQRLLAAAEERFRLLVETMPGVAYIAAPGEVGQWHYVSPRLRDLLGYDPDDWLADPTAWTRLLHPDDRDRVLTQEADWSSCPASVHVNSYRLRDSDGRYRSIQDVASSRAGGVSGEPTVWFGVLTDVTDAEDSQAALRHSEQVLRSVLETALDAFVSMDDEGRVVAWNLRAEEMFGRSADDVAGRSLADVIVSAEHRGSHTAALHQLAVPGAPDLASRRVETTALHADGTSFPVEMVLWQTTTAGSRRYHAFVRDVTDRRRMEDELRALAFGDTLTGLANRALLTSRLQEALEEAGPGGGSVALLFLDVDDFKSINDSLGHEAGDRVLCAVADRLRAGCPTAATVARFGGDEFAVLLPLVGDAEDALGQARAVAALVREPVQVQGRSRGFTASIGVAVARSSTGVGAAEVLRDADAAMYEAKRAGKDRVALFDPSVLARALARLELKADLEEALGRDELFVVYQPCVHLRTGALVGFEALLRWRHPELGVVPPLDFVPLAEETGLIRDIGDFVLREACRQATGWRGAHRGRGAPPAISVNVSTVQLRDPGFVAVVDRALAASGLEPGRLVLEITESVLLSDVSATAALLGELRARGVRIAIDDFGTGYSSLSYLQHLPLDILKIDRAFLEHLVTAPGGTSMAGMIVLIGKALGLTVVGEGVERDDQRHALIGLGCLLAQGYGLHRPMPAAEADRLVAGLSG